jgi:ABC-type multidrug transport system fused ATPase/permease subunit
MSNLRAKCRYIKIIIIEKPLLALSIFFCSCGIACLPLASAWAASNVLDSGVNLFFSKGESGYYPPFWKAIILSSFLGFSMVILYEATFFCQNRMHMFSLFYFYRYLCLRSCQLDYQFLETSTGQDLLSRTYSNSANSVTDAFNDFVALVTQLFALVCSLVIVAKVSVWIAILALVSTFPVINLLRAWNKEQYEVEFRRSERQRMIAYYSILMQDPNALQDVRVFSIEKYLMAKWESLFSINLKEDLHLDRKVRVVNFMARGIETAAYLICYSLITLLTIKRGGTVGMLAFQIGVVAAIQAKMNSVNSLIVAISKHMVFLSDIIQIDSPTIPLERKGSKEVISQINSIVFCGVSYKYPNTKRWALKNVSFEVRGGQLILLLGVNGAGKSTIVKLLAGLYTPTEGKILINERDIREYDIESLRKCMSFLMQDFTTYYLSVLENIRSGNIDSEFRKELVDDCFKRSGMDTVIDKLPKKEETMLGKIFGEGVDLSRGEKQRLALARAFYRDKKVLILDEPASMLDHETSHKLMNDLKKQSSEGKIILCITHRQDHLQWADRVIRLKNGILVEDVTSGQMEFNSEKDALAILS